VIVQTNRDVTRRGFLRGARRMRFTQKKIRKIERSPD